MSSIMRWRSGLMGWSDIAKPPVSHGVEPHDLETAPSPRVVLQFPPSSSRSRHPYRASGLVLLRGTAAHDVKQPTACVWGAGAEGAIYGDLEIAGCGRRALEAKINLSPRFYKRTPSAASFSISALRFSAARSPLSRFGMKVFTTPPAPSTRGRERATSRTPWHSGVNVEKVISARSSRSIASAI